ncbi:hypothetical protein M0805_004633 [Coniferiporia weirii]|nr:hypothetical protein M0805_004633 [Coniferiporia weirii]
MVLRCMLCSLTFSSTAARQAHVDNSPQHPRCDSCSRNFISLDAYRSHLASHAHNTNYCVQCSRSFVTPAALQQHRRSAAVHRNERVNRVSTGSTPTPGLSYQPVGEGRRDNRQGPSSHAERAGIGHRQRAPGMDAAVAELYFRRLLEDSMMGGFFDTTYFDGSSSYAGSSDEDGVINISDYGNYVYRSSSDSSDSGESDSEVDSDFLAHSDDESDTSLQIPYAQSTDLFRSTRTPISPLRSRQARPDAVASDIGPASSAVLPGFVRESVSRGPAVVSAEAEAVSAGAVSSGAGTGYMCPLCLEQKDELSSTKCGHVFCTRCINHSLEKKRQCPVCRSRVKIKSLRRIYLTI